MKSDKAVALAALVAGLAVGAEVARFASHGTPAPSCPDAARPMTRLELFFGARHGDGAAVSDDEWAGFLAREVTPRFPAGLTVVRASGQWRNAAGRVTSEPSYVLTVLHAPGDTSPAEVDAIRDAYKEQFKQESVMRVENPACVSF